MAKKSKRKGGSSGPTRGGTPKVNVKIAVGDKDLSNATRLVKPALLYADSVTLFSPAASMINEVAGLTRVTDPQEQLLVALQILDQVPALAEQANLTSEQREQISAIAKVPPRLLRAAGRAHGAEEGIEKLLDLLDEFSNRWGGFEGAIEQARANVGGTELFQAIDRGAVKVAPLQASSAGVREAVDAINAATGQPLTGGIEEMLSTFVVQTIEILRDGKSFPLLDPDASGLVRAFERENDATLDPLNVRRGGEISAAAAFMGFLPHFVDLPVTRYLTFGASSPSHSSSSVRPSP